MPRTPLGAPGVGEEDSVPGEGDRLPTALRAAADPRFPVLEPETDAHDDVDEVMTVAAGHRLRAGLHARVGPTRDVHLVQQSSQAKFSH